MSPFFYSERGLQLFKLVIISCVSTLFIALPTKMSTDELSTISRTSAPTDVGIIWKAAIDQYEEITKEKIDLLNRVSNVKEILDEIDIRETNFKAFRHSGSRTDKFRAVVSKSLVHIERLSSIVSSAASSVRQLLQLHWLEINLHYYYDSPSLLA